MDHQRTTPTTRMFHEVRDREIARRRKPRAEPEGRTTYRDPTGDRAVGNVMRGDR